MGDHPNAALVRELLDAFNTMDLEAIRSGLADDIKWHMIGGKTANGLDELAAYMGGDGEDFMITAEVHDVVGNDEHVVALVNATAQAGDETFEYRTAEIMHVKDGKVTERWAFSDDVEAINEFFGRFE